MSDKRLKLYGTAWCPKSAVLRNFLQSAWIDFDDHNVETEAQAEEDVRALYNGELKFPTLTFGDQHLKNPSIPELQAFLKDNQIE